MIIKRTFIETKEFTRLWMGEGFSDEDLRLLQNRILRNPQEGDLMTETGGLRKLRIAGGGHGKRGGIRVLYVDFEHYETTYLISLYSKDDKDDLSRPERAAIKRSIKTLLSVVERRRKSERNI